MILCLMVNLNKSPPVWFRPAGNDIRLYHLRRPFGSADTKRGLSWLNLVETRSLSQHRLMLNEFERSAIFFLDDVFSRAIRKANAF